MSTLTIRWDTTTGAGSFYLLRRDPTQVTNYEVWPFYRDMTAARNAGTIRPYVLGVILDTLSLNASIATATVIDDHVFDNLFRDRVTTNPEGEVVTSIGNNKSIHGLTFDEETVTRLTTHEPLGQTSAACLTLAWKHRTTLLGSTAS